MIQIKLTNNRTSCSQQHCLRVNTSFFYLNVYLDSTANLLKSAAFKFCYLHLSYIVVYSLTSPNSCAPLTRILASDTASVLPSGNFCNGRRRRVRGTRHECARRDFVMHLVVVLYYYIRRDEKLVEIHTKVMRTRLSEIFYSRGLSMKRETARETEIIEGDGPAYSYGAQEKIHITQMIAY